MLKYKKTTYERHRDGVKYPKFKLENPKYLKHRELKAKSKKNTSAYIKVSLSAMKMLSEEKVDLNKLAKALNTCNELKSLDKGFLRRL